MSITSYSELVDAITDRMNDSALDTYAPEFIAMAEAMFNRRLNCVDMEGTATIAAAETLALPNDYKGAMTIRISDEPPLKQLGADDFQRRWNGSTSALPENFAIYGGLIHLGPEPDQAYTVTMTYLRTLVPLSASNTSNWLLEAHPDLYLYGSLIHAEFRGWNDERLPLLGSSIKQIIAEINVQDARRRRGSQFDSVEAEYF